MRNEREKIRKKTRTETYSLLQEKLGYYDRKWSLQISVLGQILWEIPLNDMNSVPRTKINDDDDDPGDLRGFHDRNNSYSTSSSGT